MLESDKKRVLKFNSTQTMLTLTRAFDRLLNELRKIDPKNPLPLGLEDVLSKRVKEFTTKDRLPLVRQGEVPRDFYFLIRGTIFLRNYDANGDMHVIRFYRENKIVARKSFLLQERSRCDIVATKGSLLFCISHQDMKQVPGLEALMQLTVMEYDNYKVQLREELLFRDIATRIAEFYATFPSLLSARSFKIDQEIAAYLSISISTLRKFRKELSQHLKQVR